MGSKKKKPSTRSARKPGRAPRAAAPPLVKLGRSWLARADEYNTTKNVPLPGSAAEMDHARGLGRYDAPFVASGHLASAYDGATALARLWGDRRVHLVADYALIRLVTETAVVAWWIASCEDPDERAMRAFRVMMDDLERGSARERAVIKIAQTDHARLVRQGAAERIEKRRRQLQTSYEESDVVMPEGFTKKQKFLKQGELLVEAERAIPGADDIELSLLWAITSTAAHGSLTAVEQMSLRTGNDGMVAAGDHDSVLMVARVVDVLLHAADNAWTGYVGR